MRRCVSRSYDTGRRSVERRAAQRDATSGRVGDHTHLRVNGPPELGDGHEAAAFEALRHRAHQFVRDLFCHGENAVRLQLLEQILQDRELHTRVGLIGCDDVEIAGVARRVRPVEAAAGLRDLVRTDGENLPVVGARRLANLP